MMDMDLISVEKYDSFRDKYSSEPEIGAALVKILQKAGYDGLVYSNEMEGAGNSYVPFEPTQIKSAQTIRARTASTTLMYATACVSPLTQQLLIV
jgi:hypothetical protein